MKFKQSVFVHPVYIYSDGIKKHIYSDSVSTLPSSIKCNKVRVPLTDAPVHNAPDKKTRITDQKNTSFDFSYLNTNTNILKLQSAAYDFNEGIGNI